LRLNTHTYTISDEEYLRNVEIEWLFVNQKLDAYVDKEVPWTVFVTRSMYAENVMKLERNGYEVDTFFPGITKIKKGL